MGTIQKRGTTYRVLIRKQGKQPISKTFPTKAVAQRWMHRTETELADSRYTADVSSMTLAFLIERYTDEFDTIKPFGKSKLSAPVMHWV